MKDWVKLALIVTLGIAVRLVAIFVFVHGPFGPVDIYYVDRQAAHIVLNLKNPYAYAYTVHGFQEAFAYMPIVPLYYAPFYLLGDIRYGSILADVLIILAVYWIAKSLQPRSAIYAPLVYALLPVSFWLTSVSSTNIMVGTAFLALSIAATMRRRFSIGALMLGVGIAANQLVVLSLPVLMFYYWMCGKLRQISLTFLVSAAFILPFFILNPERFVYDTMVFQFSRLFQSNGFFSLYGVVYAVYRIRVSLWIRASILLFSTIACLVSFRKDPNMLLMSVGVLLSVGAFVLPVNGFWNYFLPTFALGCALLPRMLRYYGRRIVGARRMIRQAV